MCKHLTRLTPEYLGQIYRHSSMYSYNPLAQTTGIMVQYHWLSSTAWFMIYYSSGFQYKILDPKPKTEMEPVVRNRNSERDMRCKSLVQKILCDCS